MSRDALVVGINTYRYLQALQSPAHDAEAIAQVLQTYGEFRVQRLPEIVHAEQPHIGKTTPVTLRTLETALVNLFKPKGRNIPHTALFYFSGHGIQKDAGIQEGYLAVSDAQPDAGFYGLSLFWLRRLLQESPVRQRIVILDCCHSGELLNFLEADPGATAGTDRLFIAASREYESAYESLDSPYSVLTKAVHEGLDPRHASSGRVTNHYLTAWVSNCLKGEIQQPLFENSGNEIVLTRCSGIDSLLPATDATGVDICPFRGLEFFDEAHADCFFGREQLTQQLVNAVATDAFVTVIGASGSGKSSLVRAGMVPELRRGQALPGSDRWRIKLITPTEHPLRSLASAFVDPDLSDLVRAEQLRRAENFLQDKEQGLAQLVCASLSSETSTSSHGSLTGGTGRTASNLVLVIDQFEELFSLCRGAQGEQERRHFFDCLTQALQTANDRLRIVVVLRADFLGQCLRYPNVAAQIKRQVVRVMPMRYEQIKTTIVQPTKKAGLICEPNLIYTILLDVIGAPGELPLLQYTLMELWRHREIDPTGGPSRLTLNAYAQLGGVRGTLQKQATDFFDHLTPDEQTVTRRIFLALTQLGEGTEDTRRRINKAELVSPAFPLELVEQTLEKLAAAKLVITSRGGDGVKADESDGRSPRQNLDDCRLDRSCLDGGNLDIAASDIPDVVDVVHESLIRNWPLLRNWLDDSRDMLRRLRRIEQSAQEWSAISQPRKRLKGRLKTQSRTADYLLRGERLLDAERFLRVYPQELSAQGHTFVAASTTQRQRGRRKLRLLQITVPAAVAIALVASFNQYRDVIKTQSEKNYQSQVATSRERAAIAQSILQEPSHDSMAALLISRLAAEQGERTYEAQSSLRAALRDLRLQVQLEGHRARVNQIAFSPDQQLMATASADGTIRLWTGGSRAIYAQPRDQSQRLLSWKAESNAAANLSGPDVPQSALAPSPSAATAVLAPESSTPATTNIIAIVFSPDGKQIAAIAETAMQVKIWSVESGQLVQRLALPQPVKQIAFSTDGRWVAAGGDRTVSLWQAKTGKLQARLTQDWNIHSFQFSPNRKSLLLVGRSGNLQLWQLTKQLGQIAPDGSKLGGAAASSPANVAAPSPAIQPPALAIEPKPMEQSPINLRQVYDLKQPTQITQAVFSPSGRWIATASQDGVAHLWDATTGTLQHSFSQPAVPNAAGVTPSSSPIAPPAATLPPTEPPPTALPPTAPLATATLPPELSSPAPSSSAPITHLTFSPDETILAIGTPTYRAQLWNVQTRQLQAELIPEEAIAPNAEVEPGAITFSPNSRQIIIPIADAVEVWDAQTGRRLATLQSETPAITAAQFSPDSTYIATGSANGNLRLWAAAAGGELPTLSVPNVTAPWISFFNSAAASSSTPEQRQNSPRVDATLPSAASALLSITRPKFSTPPLSKIQLVERAALTTDGLVMVSPDGTVKNWQILADMRSLPAMTPAQPDAAQPDAAQPDAVRPDTDVTTVHLNRFDPQQIWQRIQRLFRPPTDHQTAAPGANESPSQVPSNPDRANPAPATDLERAPEATSSARNLSISPPLPMRMAKLTADALLTGFALSSNGQFTATANRKGWVEIRQKQADQTSIRLRLFRNGALNLEGGSNEAAPVLLQQLAFSPDNRYLLGVGADLTVRLWYVQSGQSVGTLTGHKAAIQRAQFSPDGQRVITASLDGTAMVWDVATQRKLVVLPHTTGVTSASFSPSGQWVVTTTEDGSVRIVDAATGNPYLVLGGHRGAVMDAQFSPDGRSLVTAGTDGSARLWDAQTGTEQALLRPNTLEPMALQRVFFSPDGQYVATLATDGQVHLWAATWEMLLKLARDRSLRQLTPDECGRYLRLEPYDCPRLTLNGRSRLSQQSVSGL